MSTSTLRGKFVVRPYLGYDWNLWDVRLCPEHSNSQVKNIFVHGVRWGIDGNVIYDYNYYLWDCARDSLKPLGRIRVYLLVCIHGLNLWCAKWYPTYRQQPTLLITLALGTVLCCTVLRCIWEKYSKVIEKVVSGQNIKICEIVDECFTFERMK